MFDLFNRDKKRQIQEEITSIKVGSIKLEVNNLILKWMYSGKTIKESFYREIESLMSNNDIGEVIYLGVTCHMENKQLVITK